ncbi:MAG: low specificity L-threonine aldolase [Pseudomonadota bacterium]
MLEKGSTAFSPASLFAIEGIMTFASDNWAPVAPEIMDAILRANEGAAPAYGGDDATARVQEKFAEIFERDCAVYFVSTGGAANGLALSVLTPPYGMILAHEESHIQMDECGGPELFTGGAKILPVAGFAGKLTPDAVTATLKGFPERPPHGCPATVLSLTQGAECGTVYSADEVNGLCKVAKGAGLAVHMDGARFANAVASTGSSPADLTWRAGVDVLCFGGTKNGCLAAEAVVFFDREKAADFEFRRKRAGHLWSKMRFVAAQFEAYFENELWLDLAGKANRAARRLSEGLAAIDNVEVPYTTQINEVFPVFPDGVADKLREAGHVFYPWITPGDPAGGRMHRLICSYRTSDEEITTFLDAVRHATAEIAPL